MHPGAAQRRRDGEWQLGNKRAIWGGFVTGDQITLDWDTDCACGRTSVFVHDSVSRYSEARGGDDKINCVAALDAHAEALDYLTSQ